MSTTTTIELKNYFAFQVFLACQRKFLLLRGDGDVLFINKNNNKDKEKKDDTNNKPIFFE